MLGVEYLRDGKLKCWTPLWVIQHMHLIYHNTAQLTCIHTINNQSASALQNKSWELSKCFVTSHSAPSRSSCTSLLMATFAFSIVHTATASPLAQADEPGR